MLSAMGLDATIVTGRPGLDLLDWEIEHGPQILLVGVGPFGLIPHWLLVWDRTGEEYVAYDSWPFSPRDPMVILGNRTISKERLLALWVRCRTKDRLRISIKRPH